MTTQITDLLEVNYFKDRLFSRFILNFKKTGADSNDIPLQEQSKKPKL